MPHSSSVRRKKILGFRWQHCIAVSSGARRGRSNPSSSCHLRPCDFTIAVLIGMVLYVSGHGVATEMTCKACGSERQSKFNGEIAVHFPGLQGLDKPIVWLFPQFLICLNCGVAQFMVPEADLAVLAEDRSRGSAAG